MSDLRQALRDLVGAVTRFDGNHKTACRYWEDYKICSCGYRTLSDALTAARAVLEAPDKEEGRTLGDLASEVCAQLCGEAAHRGHHTEACRKLQRVADDSVQAPPPEPSPSLAVRLGPGRQSETYKNEVNYQIAEPSQTSASPKQFVMAYEWEDGSITTTPIKPPIKTLEEMSMQHIAETVPYEEPQPSPEAAEPVCEWRPARPGCDYAWEGSCNACSMSKPFEATCTCGRPVKVVEGEQ